MKVFIAIILIIGSVSARGSGPYLPSGWRPQGPAFYLPSEEAKPADSPHKESLNQETEASGSETFREYGPPKPEEVVLNVNQGLPEIATEQAFFVEVQNNQVTAAEQTSNIEVTTEQLTIIVEELPTVTESQAVEKATELSDVQPTAAQNLDVQVEVTSEAVKTEQSYEPAAPSITVGEVTVVPTAGLEVVFVPLGQQELVQDFLPTIAVESVASGVVNEVVPTAVIEEQFVPVAPQEFVQDAVPTPALEVVNSVPEVVNNIADNIVNLEKEVKVTEVLASGNIAEINTTQKTESEGSLEKGQGSFLEYGPPGFAEYGPPKHDERPRLVTEGNDGNTLESNEVRRRRFSPKLSSAKKY